MADEKLTRDYLTDEEKAEIKQLLENEIEAGLGPYLDQISRGVVRLARLAAMAEGMKQVATNIGVRTDGKVGEPVDVSDDMLRAVVVLNHAYLEDFLRTLGRVFLPLASESDLNRVSLVDTEGRAEKFFLGALKKHRGKTVENLINESVSEHLEKRSFNEFSEIICFLKSMGLDVPNKSDSEALLVFADQSKVPADLDAMIRRRHMIVHNADLDKGGNQLQPIETEQVIHWLKVTQFFLSNLASASFQKEHPLELIQDRIRKAMDEKRRPEGDS
jgi:hypothetical protein